MAKVLIADDHEIVRAGVRRLLEELEHVVVAEAGSGEEAVQLARSHKPEIALIDIHMPGMGGMEATRRIRRQRPGCRVIILTAHLDGPLPKTLLEVGVDGFLAKGSSVGEMDEAIAQVRRGKRYISHQVAQRLALAAVEGERESPFDRLTNRELQIALKLLNGEANNMIAEELAVSPKTITTYRYRILNKTGTRSMSELLRLAIQHELVSCNRDLPPESS